MPYLSIKFLSIIKITIILSRRKAGSKAVPLHPQSLFRHFFHGNHSILK